MYLHTVSDRDSGSIFEEPFDGRSLSKLNLCEDGECLWLGLGHEIDPDHRPPPQLILHRLTLSCSERSILCFLIHVSQHICDQQDETHFKDGATGS